MTDLPYRTYQLEVTAILTVRGRIDGPTAIEVVEDRLRYLNRPRSLVGRFFGMQEHKVRIRSVQDGSPSRPPD